MKIRLLVGHAWGSKGSVIEVADKDAAGMIRNRIAEPAEGPSLEVANKKLDPKRVRKTALVNPNV